MATDSPEASKKSPALLAIWALFALLVAADIALRRRFLFGAPLEREAVYCASILFEALILWCASGQNPSTGQPPIRCF